MVNGGSLEGGGPNISLLDICSGLQRSPVCDAGLPRAR